MKIRGRLALLSLLMLGACSARETPAPPDASLFVAVRIPEALTPLERGAKYEDPLHEALQSQGLGEVSGGGTRLGSPDADGRQDIEAVDIDVELVDADRGLPALRAELKKLNAPGGTALSYEREGRHFEEPLW